MKKQNHTLRGGVVRSALALTLAVGLMPAQALTTIAVADEGAPQSTPAEQPEGIVAQTVKLDGAQASSASQQSAASSDAVAQSSASAVQKPEDAPLVSSTSASESATATERDEIDIVSASVQLGAAHTVVTCGGMSFAVDDATGTAALVSIANSSLAGELVIPESISTGDAAYAVTSIGTQTVAGGGSLI